MNYQLAAAGILIIFYGCYFIKMMLQRHKGIRTDQMGRGKTGPSRRIEIAMKAGSVAVPMIEMISVYLNLTALSNPLRTAGTVTALAGDVVFVISVLTMKDSWRAGVSENEKTELVTTGIYGVSRNPAFLGFDLMYVGLLLMFFNPVLLAATAYQIVMFHLQITRVEEPFLERAFGKAYAEYRGRVRRYLGRRV